jgi:hypothetical protein
MLEQTTPADGGQLDASRRFGLLALALVLGYVLVVQVQGGDFWPFSRFAMFSNPAKPWRRAVVRQLRADEFAQPLTEVFEKALPGTPYPIAALGIDVHDLSAAVRSVDGPLTPAQAQLIAGYFQRSQEPHLVLYVARGWLRSRDKAVSVRYRPIARITKGDVHDAFPAAPVTP